MRSLKTSVLLAITGLLLLACANQMQPAQAALDGATSAVQAASADASKYMPAHLQTLQARLSSLKAAFDNKDYAGVLASAPAITADAQQLAKEVAAKKAEAMQALAAQWTDMSSSVPKLIDAVQTHLSELSKSKHAPKGVDLATARTDLADATTLWDKAQASQKSGDVETAVSSAKDVKAKVESAAEALKLKLPT
jgi:hypothetical protein